MQITFDVITQLEKQRKRYGIELDELCDEAKTNRTTYQRWLRKETSPRGAKLDAFVQALNDLKSKRGRP